jgi:hypothetical protein
MNPDPSRLSPPVFGRTPSHAARAAILLALLGGAAVAGVERFLTRPHTPIGDAFLATGIPPWLPLVLGLGIVLALAVFGYWRSVRSAEQFRLTSEGLQVDGPLGCYVLEWRNIREAEVTPTGSLGIRVADRDAVLQTHQGTEQQREWLRTMEPYNGWDFLYPQADLGYPPETVLSWLQPFLDKPQMDANERK